MVLLPLLSLLLLGSIEAVTASVLLGRQRPPYDVGTTLALDKRQGTTAFITFSTIFLDGDASRTRTAESGFDIRVDIANSAWGFCGSDNPGQCDMAGTCVDGFSCSKGCGFGNTALPTWTCNDPRARYCSTALLTLSSDSPRAVTYLACADKPDRTQEYKAFTTTTTTTSAASSRTAAPTPLPTLQQTSQTSTTTDTSPSQTATESVPTTTSAMGTGTGTPNAPSSSSSSADPANNSNNNSTTNTAMIVGATVGCVALICICAVVVFLIRRSRDASAAAATGGGSGAAVAPVQQGDEDKPPLGELYSGYGDHAVYEMGSQGEGEVQVVGGWEEGYHGPAAAVPVELSSGTEGWGR